MCRRRKSVATSLHASAGRPRSFLSTNFTVTSWPRKPTLKRCMRTFLHAGEHLRLSRRKIQTLSGSFFSWACSWLMTRSSTSHTSGSNPSKTRKTKPICRMTITSFLDFRSSTTRPLRRQTGWLCLRKRESRNSWRLWESVKKETKKERKNLRCKPVIWKRIQTMNWSYQLSLTSSLTIQRDSSNKLSSMALIQISIWLSHHRLYPTRGRRPRAVKRAAASKSWSKKRKKAKFTSRQSGQGVLWRPCAQSASRRILSHHSLQRPNLELVIKTWMSFDMIWILD